MQKLELLINELLKQKESEWLEFKTNNSDIEVIGKDISAIANGAAITNRKYGYMVWGIDDNRKIVGTSFDPLVAKIKNQELSNYLHKSLSDNARFEFNVCIIDSINSIKIVVLKIESASQYPIMFDNISYIRDGSYTNMLAKTPALESKLWTILNSNQYELLPAREDNTINDVKELLDYHSFITLMKIPDPTNDYALIDLLKKNELIMLQDNGLYSVTNMGAILFSNDMSVFPELERKRLRIIRYNGNSKTNIARQDEDNRGYVLCFEEILKMLKMFLPSSEIIIEGTSELKEHYSSIAVRELLANAMIHQDFTVTGVNLSVEIFSNRVIITNPGKLLIDKNHLIDSNRTRNVKIASMMRKLKFCEEVGSGWDKIVESCETSFLPTPVLYTDENVTSVTLIEPTNFQNMAIEDRVWCCYTHVCNCHARMDYATNTTLRERFGLDKTDSNTVQISNLLKETKKRGLIKPFDENTAPRRMKYIPFWA